MVTNKKRLRRGFQFLLLAVAAGWLAGCTPSGPRALLEGKRLLEQGRNSEAVDELKIATSILSTNAQAWNYLGLAYHHSGQAANAAEAYQRALGLNHDLVAVHYNLGCLLLEQNRSDTLESAANELTAFVVRQGNVMDGWLKLGTAQLRLNQLASADTSFREAMRLNAQNPEALNDLGMVQFQRRRWRDAASYFNAALKQQPNYAPALLNLATVELYLNNRPLALQKYQDYLALTPHPANWDTVNAAAQQLDLELNPPPRAVVTNSFVAVNPATNHPPSAVVSNTPPVDITATVPKPLPVAPYHPPTPAESGTRPEVVNLPDGPAIVVPGNASNISTIPSTAPPIADTEPSPVTSVQPEKRGFFQRLNPMGLFRHQPKPTNTLSQPPTLTTFPDLTNKSFPASNETRVVASTPPPVRVVSLPRYPYLSPTTPEAGNRAEAERLIAKGGEAQRDHRSKDAIGFYRAATQTDPSDFDAQFDLGSAALDANDLPQALRAFEQALMINPDSFNARFYFGLALKNANYIYDSSQELENLLAAHSTGETAAHLALVHLTLGNLYADQFHQPAPARSHYQKVLQLDPHNSQGTAIRYWLQNNP